MKTFKTLVFSIGEAATILLKHFNCKEGDRVIIDADVTEQVKATLKKELEFSQTISAETIAFLQNENKNLRGREAEHIKQINALKDQLASYPHSRCTQGELENYAKTLLLEGWNHARGYSVNKMAAIKAVRMFVNLNPKEATDLVEAMLPPR